VDHPPTRQLQEPIRLRSLYQGWNAPCSDDDHLDEEQQAAIAEQTAQTIVVVEEARLAWKRRKEIIAQQAAARSAAATAAGTRPLKPNPECIDTPINIKPSAVRGRQKKGRKIIPLRLSVASSAIDHPS
jgi:hypothetical protein